MAANKTAALAGGPRANEGETRTVGLDSTREVEHVAGIAVCRDTIGVPQPAANTFDRSSACSPPSQLLAGRYLVLAELGRGAAGVVYRAYDKTIGREVAIKLLQTGHPESQERLVEEARAMAKLSDPHVIAVYDVVPVDSGQGSERSAKVLLAMQYVEGESLDAWLSAERSIEAVLDVFRQAGRGLMAAHRAGLVHRDFKPANVLISEAGRAFVTDFGIAGVAREAATSGWDGSPHATFNGQIVGTPWYMPPEQHLGLSVDPRADQYAFCVSLWEALARTPLFGDITEFDALLARKHHGVPPWPSTVEVPAKIAIAIARGLSHDPEDRFSTMAELLAALTLEEKRPRSLAAAGFASAAVVIGTFGWSWHHQRAQRCTGAEEHLHGVWDDGRREQIRSALLATELGYAADTAVRVGQTLDHYAGAWAEQHRSACEATTVLGEQPPEVMDLRIACLQRAKADLLAVTDLLAQADAQVVEKARDVLGGLSPLERCADIEALRSDVSPPDPADAGDVDAARATLATVKALFNAGKYREAQTSALALAARAESIDYGPLLTEVLLTLGEAENRAGAYAESESTLKRAMRSALRWKQWALAHRAAARLTFVVGGVRMRSAEGLSYALTAEALLAWAEPLDEMRLYSQIGVVHEKQQRNGEAEAAFRVALEIAERSSSPDDVSSSIVRLNLGNALLNQGRYAEAEREYRAALALFSEQLGPMHPYVAESRLNVASSLEARGQHVEAEQEFSAVLLLVQQTLGPEHPLAARCRLNLTKLAFLRGDYPRAEVEARATLDLLQKIHGPEHVEVATARSNLAGVLLTLGQYEEAETELREVHALFEKLLGREHPLIGHALTSVGVALQALGRYEEAEAKLRAGLTLRQRVLDPEHLDIAQSRHYLGYTLSRQDRHAEAEVEYRAAMALQEKVLGADHLEVAASRTSLAELLSEQGRLQEAQTLYGEALAVREDVLGSDHPDTIATRESLHRVIAARR